MTSLGYRYTDEQKLRLSIAMKKVFKNKSAWNKGKGLSLEHIEKIRNAQFIRIENGTHNLYKDGRTKNKKYRSWSKNKRNRIKRVINNNGIFHLYEEWEKLKAQYNWTCPCCGKSEPEIKLTEDHIIPLSRGGSDNIENIQPLCKSCNSRKNNKIVNVLQLC